MAATQKTKTTGKNRMKPANNNGISNEKKFPMFGIFYSTNLGLCNAKHPSKLMLAVSNFEQFNNFSNLIGSKFSVFTSIFICNKMSLFRNAIFGVIRNSSKKKVVWIYAQRIVAFVTNKYSLWNRAILKNPRSSMRPKCFAPASYFSVTIFGCAANPVPASIFAIFINFNPEKFFKCFKCFHYEK